MNRYEKASRVATTAILILATNTVFSVSAKAQEKVEPHHHVLVELYSSQN